MQRRVTIGVVVAVLLVLAGIGAWRAGETRPTAAAVSEPRPKRTVRPRTPRAAAPALPPAEAPAVEAPEAAEAPTAAVPFDHDERVLVDGIVVDDAGYTYEGRVLVTTVGCGGEQRRLVRGGRFSWWLGADTPCALVAIDLEHDGPIANITPPVPVHAGPDGVADVELVVDTRPRGGLGIAFAKTADGAVEVTTVWPGTPAAALGLEPGDVIVAVDGAEVAAMTPEAFVARLSGAEGTAVDVTWASDGVEATATITRTALVETAPGRFVGDPGGQDSGAAPADDDPPAGDTGDSG